MNHLNCTKSTLHKNLFAPPSINENHSFLSCLLRGNKNDYYLYNGYNHVLKTLKKYLSVKIMVNRFAPWNIFSVVWVKKIYIKKCSYSRKKLALLEEKIIKISEKNYSCFSHKNWTKPTKIFFLLCRKKCVKMYRPNVKKMKIFICSIKTWKKMEKKKDYMQIKTNLF